MTIKNPNERSVKDVTVKESENTQKHEMVDVLVLGGGLAGLGAALELKNKKFNYMILEGQAIAGGRVNTMEMLDYDVLLQNKTVLGKQCDFNHNNDNNLSDDTIFRETVHNFIDSGAQWLHGKYNALHDLAEQHHLLMNEQSEEGLGTFMRDDGLILDDYLIKKIDFCVGEILTECEKYAQNNLNIYPKSVNSFLLERFQEYLQNIEDVAQQQYAKQLLDWHIRFQIIDNSCLSLDHVSAKSWGKYSYNGESCQAHYNFKNGFSSVVNALVLEIGEKNIRFNKSVIEIEVNPRKTNLPVVSVKCLDNHIFYANHVIVTFSMGCLQFGLNNGLFKPSLPEPIEQTIRDIGFQTINKLFFQFKEPWWGDNDGIQLVFRNESYEVNSNF